MIKEYTLEGIDGNSYSIMGYVAKAMKETRKYTGYTRNDIDSYIKSSTSGNYDNLVVESMRVLDSINSKLFAEGLHDEEV